MTTIENKAGMIDDSLSKSVERTVHNHLQVLNNKDIVDLYKAVIEHCRYNQCRAAILLGVSRGTLRARLKYYFGDQYVGSRG
jgi:DNA-binding protein Fis